ncbi:hypothetical protein ABT294_03880 [Nonomuraea sp. NPDC000554]|uniref:hypothetical protein n=1 Tax=Nonomuraea sp. NPDC000554 TaxID=3154259 RepID=UPI00332ED603
MSHRGSPYAAASRGISAFSITAKMEPKIKAAIAGIDESGWTPITYPNAAFDDQAGGWISDADLAEVDYTAFTGKKGQAVTARLIVHRVRRQARLGQDELFAAHCYHASRRDSSLFPGFLKIFYK